MVTLVNDMSHQCKIVESLICHVSRVDFLSAAHLFSWFKRVLWFQVDWYFGDGNLDDLKASIIENTPVPEADTTSSNHDVLLENIRKVEGESTVFQRANVSRASLMKSFPFAAQSPVTAKDIVSTIIGAANRKKQKTSKVSSSTRKVNSLSATISQVGSSSEDILDAGHSYQVRRTLRSRTV